jgi:competence ComEA-like helix-hairpin-helix protein
MRNNAAMQTSHADAGGSRSLGLGFVATLIIVLAGAILLTSLGRTPLRSGQSGQSAPIATVRIALNEASEAELALLPEIGDRTAAAIVADRGANGPFTSVEDLQRIRGIGPATVEAIRPFVTVTTRDGGA